MTVKITVLGAGPGGLFAAVRAAQLNAEVTIVEADGLGGTCLNRGCIPSKIMREAGALMMECERFSKFGVNLPGPPEIDMAQLSARRQEVVAAQAKGVARILEKNGVRMISGRGFIEGPQKLTVTAGDGSTQTIEWDRLIIAAGAGPRELPHIPFDGEQVISSTEALSLESVPESVVIAGGGVIGCEFATIFSTLGSRVSLVEAMERLLPLPLVDESCSKTLLREFKKQKIKCYLGRAVESIRKSGGSLDVTIGGSPLKPQTDPPAAVVEPAEKLLVCVGRSPGLSGMGLENIGIETDSQGWIKANSRMETPAENVYAVGDVLGPSKLMLAYVASKEGMTAAENALGQCRQMRYEAVPNVVFTLPEVASVGLTRERAAEEGYSAGSETVLFRSLGKPQVTGNINGQAQVVFDTKTEQMLGVHIVGPKATDIIPEATLAVNRHTTVRDVAQTMHGHPTHAEIMEELAAKAIGREIYG
ncbi:MAG: dihydrolipoyl dehydrogenase [Desulfosalsimonadaceae bacterium]